MYSKITGQDEINKVLEKKKLNPNYAIWCIQQQDFKKFLKYMGYGHNKKSNRLYIRKDYRLSYYRLKNNIYISFFGKKELYKFEVKSKLPPV